MSAPTDPIWPLVEAQQRALQEIRPGAIYTTALGRAVGLEVPEGENPPEQIYLNGLELESASAGESLRVTASWEAIVSAETSRLQARALQVQAEMIHALRGVCGVRLTRLPIAPRPAGSLAMVAGVQAIFTVAEIQR